MQHHSLALITRDRNLQITVSENEARNIFLIEKFKVYLKFEKIYIYYIRKNHENFLLLYDYKCAMNIMTITLDSILQCFLVKSASGLYRQGCSSYHCEIVMCTHINAA